MNIYDYLGKFHPLAVHLPIGILVVFIILGLFIPKKQLLDAYVILRLLLLVSALSATFSSLSGYILSGSDSYDTQLVSGHKFLAIVLTIVNWIVVFTLNYLLRAPSWIFNTMLIIVLMLLIFTGHAGGALTHGSDFISPPSVRTWLSSDSTQMRQISMNTTAFEATSIILEQKCYSCHGKNKQKGNLRLDTREGILNGGENGKLIGAEGTFVHHILLPLDDEEHMPPKEKKQLLPIEINYLVWWIENGSDFDHSLSTLNLPDSLSGIIAKEGVISTNNQIPDEEVQPADSKVLENLRKLNVIVTPIGRNSNFLSVRFVNVLQDSVTAAMDELTRINPQLIWLNLDDQKLHNEDWDKVGLLSNLRKLSVRNSNITDTHVSSLLPLTKLVSLNLVGTAVSDEGLIKINNLAMLEFIYIYQTNVDRAGFESLQAEFPDLRIDSGNYSVPIFASDTTIFKR